VQLHTLAVLLCFDRLGSCDGDLLLLLLLLFKFNRLDNTTTSSSSETVSLNSELRLTSEANPAFVLSIVRATFILVFAKSLAAYDKRLPHVLNLNFIPLGMTTLNAENLLVQDAKNPKKEQ